MKYYIKYKMINPRDKQEILLQTKTYNTVQEAEKEYIDEAMARTAFGILEMVYAYLYRIEDEKEVLETVIVEHRK